MMDKSFEKQISDKLNSIEVQPSEGTLQSIFEKRASRPKAFAGIGYSGLALLVLVVSVTAVSYFMLGEGYANKTLSSSTNSKIDEKRLAEKPELPLDKQKDSKHSGNGNVNTSASQKIANGANIASEKSKAQHSQVEHRNRSKANSEKIVSPVALVSEKVNNQNDNAVDPNAYFNTGAKNRPIIEREEHRGNSHLYVYQAMSDKDMSDKGFVFSRLNSLNKFPMFYQTEDLAAVNNYISLPAKKNDIKRIPLFVDIMFSPSLNMPSSTGNGSLQQFSNAMSQKSYNSQFGLRVSMPISKQFSIFTGINYRMQSNAYKGNFQYTSSGTRIDQNISYINDPVKGVVKVTTYDTVNYSNNKQMNVNHRNSYKLFQIPLGLSYNFGYGKFDFAFHGSALINIFRNSNGKSINLEQHSTNDFSSNKTFTGIGAGLSWMAAYKVSPKIRLILEPGLQYFGIQSMKAGNNMNEKSLSPQLSIGLRYTVF